MREGLDAAGLLAQKGLSGARARRRGLSDSALAEPRRRLRYKTGWYGSRLVEADRWYPSSKTCHRCLAVQDIGWAQRWTCDGCGTSHHRDDNAAINLARYEHNAAVGPVACYGRPSGTTNVELRLEVDGAHGTGVDQVALILHSKPA